MPPEWKEVLSSTGELCRSLDLLIQRDSRASCAGAARAENFTLGTRCAVQWEVVLLFLAATFLYVASLVRKWRNPKCNGVLPPGSMGIPLIGETFQILIPSYSLDIHPFFTKRIKRYGTIFRTSLAGIPVVVSTDREFNDYVIQQEGKSVELWYMNTFSKLMGMDGTSRLNEAGEVHKYIRGTLLNQFGCPTVKQLLPEMQKFMLKSLEKWSIQPSVDMKKAAYMIRPCCSSFPLFICSADTISKTPPEIMYGRFNKILKGLVAFSWNVPGFAFHKCVKEHNRFTNILKGILKDRLSSKNPSCRADLIDDIIKGMKEKDFMTEDATVQLMFSAFFASFEAISSIIEFLLTLISENDRVIKDLIAENASIVGNGEKDGACISWEQLKSLEFTNQVIKETLRLANIVPGIFRRAVEDVHVKGMTIPAGWTLMLVNFPVHMNPDLYINPLEFNPWCWKEIDSHTTSKNLMPFGGGIGQCLGADYSRVVLTMWKKIKGGEVFRNPLMGLKGGLHLKFSKYDEPESASSVVN
ncbi:hypothetical protein MLD38_022966 [Melastoma candidum]|uniref:Uncharacterized protein n=1 Tax=Melastoma candidum TaxID=119954 RepID=A0ACB9QM68_9MYRT|nr:hypothetical protein MLD38_022966 [Melastoma candidum]